MGVEKMSGTYCTKCGSDHPTFYHQHGKWGYDCTSCRFEGKPSRWVWLAQLYFMLKIKKK